MLCIIQYLTASCFDVPSLASSNTSSPTLVQANTCHVSNCTEQRQTIPEPYLDRGIQYHQNASKCQRPPDVGREWLCKYASTPLEDQENLGADGREEEPGVLPHTDRFPAIKRG
jgi:hypothetical protein